MMIRAMANLDLGKGRIIYNGSIFSSTRLKPHAIKTLMDMEKIAPVSMPPLHILMPEHAELATIGGIETTDEFLEYPYVDLASILGIKPDKALSIQNYILEQFIVHPPSG